MSKDVKFHETSPYFTQHIDASNQEKLFLEFYPLPKAEESIQEMETPKTVEGNKAQLTESETINLSNYEESYMSHDE